MKFIALACLLLSFHTLAEVPSRLIKVLDGTTAICKSKQDIVRQVNGAYRLSKQNVSLENEILKLSYNAEFFTCGEFSGEIGFKAIGFSETFEQTIYSLNRGISTATISTETAELRFMRDGVYKIVSTINMENAPARINTEIALSDLLNEAELLKLSNGESITVSVDAFLIKKVIFTSSELTMKNPISFGAFRTLMTISSNNGVLSAALQ
ncbi:MAG: hypothetical protein ACLGG0_06960 [Bacteriovoracia bacterium]